MTNDACHPDCRRIGQHLYLAHQGFDKLSLTYLTKQH